MEQLCLWRHQIPLFEAELNNAIRAGWIRRFCRNERFCWWRCLFRDGRPDKRGATLFQRIDDSESLRESHDPEVRDRIHREWRRKQQENRRVPTIKFTPRAPQQTQRTRRAA